ncbi:MULTISPECIES: hypothetical protein [unclassified Arthrobacter]|uniref:hypothetical protein n=1 Tax=unclassified Arthrobacter TaxID=235627 RepID=UPI00159D760B|nr:MULTISPECIES: hypothetical protein [unclassified Arthrobacter]MCQ9164895.1 hypothetical protein [Arthrobacter sp. STN4]NVM98192.1 hypothetical protein [Arthrobacter sp. SDTb3-6]
MSRRQHFIPSQRLPVSVASATTEAKPHRSLLWAVGITLLGWLVLAYPAVLLALLSYLYMAGTGASPATAGSVVAGLAGMVFVLCMVAAPLLTGLAVSRRRRGLWVGAAVTWALTAVALVYLLVNWFLPLG